jgi:hypothetical protein
MRTATRTVILVIITSAAAAADATAALGWLERLSGPGPFKGPQYAFTLACYGWPGPLSASVGGSAQVADPAASDGHATILVPFWRCHEVDPNQLLDTNDNPLSYAALQGQPKPGVRAVLVVPYASVSVAVGFDAGIGFGFVRFTDRNSDVDFSSTKVLFQPIRLTIKPLAPFFDSTKWDFLQLAFNGTLILQTIRDTDFGALPGTFREPTEMLWQTELRIDIGQLVFPGQKRNRRR